ncbi:ferric iron reductase [Steroidobacter flavus]|uniref:Ferric iron reductase n=1 Tax=Steroidobacter flavus TaxID=1842136 RepID=A0ABV8SYD7_9GAMM
MLSTAALRPNDDELVQQLPPALRAWLTFERFHLHEPQVYQRVARDPRFDVKYFPQNCGVYRLPCFQVPRRYLHVIGAVSGGKDSVDDPICLPIHPSALDSFREFLRMTGAEPVRGPIWAVATSSTRTVLAWPDNQPEQASFLKTSLHSPIFGDRRVTRIKAGRSVSLSALVHAELDELPANLRFLPEPLGFAPRGEPAMGAIVRAIPREIEEEQVILAPLFSLIGGSGERVPLLLSMLERTDMQPLEFVHDLLCAPFAKLWLELALDHGLMLEAHGQDLLMALSDDSMPRGCFYYRDFEGLQVDWELRRCLGKRMPVSLAGQWCWHESYETLGAHRYADQLWFKWRISLTQYLHFVLHQTETALRAWREEGRIGGASIEPDEITLLFSRCLFDELRRMFGPVAAAGSDVPYNIYRSLNRFLLLLTKLRRARLQELRRLDDYSGDLTAA